MVLNQLASVTIQKIRHLSLPSLAQAICILITTRGTSRPLRLFPFAQPLILNNVVALEFCPPQWPIFDCRTLVRIPVQLVPGHQLLLGTIPRPLLRAEALVTHANDSSLSGLDLNYHLTTVGTETPGSGILRAPTDSPLVAGDAATATGGQAGVTAVTKVKIIGAGQEFILFLPLNQITVTLSPAQRKDWRDV